jgi:hypothetical protein
MQIAGTLGVMCSAAPRLDPRLVKMIVRLDDESLPIAETYRRTRDHAAQMGIPRPSYECFRGLIHDARRERRRRRANRETLIRVALYLDPVHALDGIEPRYDPL